MYCSILAWWIVGLTTRYNSKGRLAIGAIVPADTDSTTWSQTINAENSIYQVKSGKFMSIYYII